MKTYTIEKWAEHFGIEILDNDGFPYKKMTDVVTLEEFLRGSGNCTIDVKDFEKHRTLRRLYQIL